MCVELVAQKMKTLIFVGLVVLVAVLCRLAEASRGKKPHSYLTQQAIHESRQILRDLPQAARRLQNSDGSKSTAKDFNFDKALEAAWRVENLVYQRFEFHNQYRRQFFLGSENMPDTAWDLFKYKVFALLCCCLNNFKENEMRGN